MPSKIEFTVNGKKCSVNECTPRETTLNAYLRYVLALPGTKAMCHEGGCGSCIVMVRARRYPSGIVETFSVNSCLVLVLSCNGWEITTVEGVGNRLDGYSDVQKRLVAFNGSQCGYCTPGWIMHLTSLVDKNLTMSEMEESFGSNTCRCTGFRPILDTIKSFAIDASPEICQRVRDIEELNGCSKNARNCQRKCSSNSDCSDWSVVADVKKGSPMRFDYGKYKFFKVYEIQDIFDIFSKYGVDSYMLVDGNTAKGILETFEYPNNLIDISEVMALKTYDYDQNLVLGANVSLEDCIKIFKEASSKKSEFAYLTELVKHLKLVAHIPVRKIGSIAGNLMYKHKLPRYKSDLFLLFACIGATVTVRYSNGDTKSLKMKKFLKTDMEGGVLINVEIPPLSSSHVFRSYKIMPRNQNALAHVNAAFLLKLGRKKVIESASIVIGNIDPEFINATKTEAFLVGKNIFNDVNLQAAIQVLSKELKPIEIPGEPSPQSRKKLALGLFYKFILNISPAGTALSKYISGGELLQRPVSSGKEDFQTDSSLYPLNKPVDKLEAKIQVGGEARFANDIPPLPREVFGAFVLSTTHSGEVDTIDVDDVMSKEGVVAFYTAKDIPGVNSFGFPGIQLQTEEEEILATKIKFYGQPIAVVVATSEKLAEKVAKQVKVTYKNVGTKPPVLTIDEAKKDSKRYVAGTPSIEPNGKGDNVTKVIKGILDLEAQYHYYIEPITCVVVPVDKGLEVYDSSQWMDLSQIAIARSLGIQESEVVVKVRRVGGGFGGKISRNVQASAACALVAKKLDRPCRFILPMQTNMATAGKRLPCQCDYEVGVDNDGKIQYLNATIVQDNGCSNNENILDFVVGGFPNCYNTEYWSLKTATVTTDTPSNSFARAPGTCEGITSIEHIMQHIAFAVQKDPTDVRKANMRTEDNDLPEMIETLKKDADYDRRVTEIEQFNKTNRWMKKSISVNVMCFPVIFYGNYSALVSIYRGDGTVTVSTGGIEMGQGINTKCAQVCAYKLGIPLEYVKIVPNHTFIAANNVFSGSSITTESCVYAIIKACEVLEERLAPIKESMPDATWKQIIQKAGEEQVDLTSLYMMKDTDENLKGYSAFAVSIIEVLLDVTTGRFQIVRADVLEDVGVSANPKLDVGQVQGAYIQGIGYFTCEKLIYDKTTGKLETNRSLTYHVPLALDIPVEYNVKLRYNHKNPNGVLGSKTCGEMGICSAHGITHALRQCIMESRKDSGYDPNEWIYIPVPYETEVILKALDVKPEEFLLNA
ncbi:indole-3-acetaldehyde oxidase-like [Spodoptera litura]|uniref:Indole-3-acetaldehyde oxidase-like n=1 Tax=Spodoptera litura TaxID=69820 RepID=A0A9J7IUT1_SPOLT|nr:indole-3-acetaldehyde oxidase-like [Spodoptera litura]